RPVEVANAAAVLGVVVGDDGAADRQRALVVDAASIVAGGVARDGAAADRQRALVVDAAAEEIGVVARDGAAPDRQRGAGGLVDAPAGLSSYESVVGHCTVADRQGPLVEDAAGVAVQGAALLADHNASAACDRQAAQGDRDVRGHFEHPRNEAATDSQLVGPRALD